MPDEGVNLPFEIARQVVVVEQNAVLQGLVPSLDLSLGLWMIRGAAHVLHALGFEPLAQITRDVTRCPARVGSRGQGSTMRRKYCAGAVWTLSYIKAKPSHFRAYLPHFRLVCRTSIPCAKIFATKLQYSFVSSASKW